MLPLREGNDEGGGIACERFATYQLLRKLENNLRIPEGTVTHICVHLCFLNCRIFLSMILSKILSNQS